MENKDKTQKSKLTTTKLTKIFSLIWFGLVFVFTFIFGYAKASGGDQAAKKALNDNMGIVAGSIFGALGVAIIVWLILFLVIRKRSKTENDKKIEQTIDLVKKQQEEEQKKKEEEISNA